MLALAGLALVADAGKLAAEISTFDLGLLPAVLALSVINYLLRWWRWELYLARLGVRLPRGRSLAVFLVGFLLSVTPGKAGELGKAWIIRELGGGPARRVVPAVIAERVTDLAAALLLLTPGALRLPGGAWIAAAGLAAAAAMVLLLTWRRGATRLFALLERLPLIGRRMHFLGELYEGLRDLISPGRLELGLVLAFFAWGAEAVGFWLVVRHYAPEADFLLSVFNYTASTSLGGLSVLPGGLVAVEGMLTALLDSQGLSTAAAASATLIIRAATLWFSVLLGLAALPFVARWMRRGERAT
ncbi:MAG TPA: lysylphosphatidylglycerol synthase transmembrane domain-containing protein [Thermoanaerobaculia bacterium]|nr:lysylphosphatidylglycerol synthase transmembrane domain-containing protein [Thermoanaerobaculia bacterium]